MTGANLYILSIVLWIIWGIALIKRPWKSLDKQIIEVQIYIMYMLALIFIGIVFRVIGVL